MTTQTNYYGGPLMNVDYTMLAGTVAAQTGSRIKEIREEQGLSIREAADKADINWHTWKSLETHGHARITTLIDAAAALGYDTFIELEPR